VALLFLHQMQAESAKCLALAREALPRLSGSSASVMAARSGLDCALGLKKDDAGRAAAVAEMEAATRGTLAPPGVGAAADDVSTSYLSLIQARKDAGDAAGATKDAEAWASFLEAQAKAARTPEQRAVFDSHRLSAYMELKQPERAIPMLLESERDLPSDYNPPARLAVAYFEMKKLDEALAASNRALPKVKGPRRVQVLQRRSDIFAARGDAAAAREALEQALASAEALPPGQRSERTIQALKKKLEAPPAKPTS
jgi:tetratricopeptide (TPR) repeat protein